MTLGSHPQRELTPIPRLGLPCPRLGMAAGATLLPPAPEPHPRRELTPMLVLGFTCPRTRMAAGATFSQWRAAPPASASRIDVFALAPCEIVQRPVKRQILHAEGVLGDQIALFVVQLWNDEGEHGALRRTAS